MKQSSEHNDQGAGENIIFEDDVLSPDVLVTNSRVRVGGNSYSLEGVVEVRANITVGFAKRAIKHFRDLFDFIDLFLPAYEPSRRIQIKLVYPNRETVFYDHDIGKPPTPDISEGYLLYHHFLPQMGLEFSYDKVNKAFIKLFGLPEGSPFDADKWVSYKRVKVLGGIDVPRHLTLEQLLEKPSEADLKEFLTFCEAMNKPGVWARIDSQGKLVFSKQKTKTPPPTPRPISEAEVYNALQSRAWKIADAIGSVIGKRSKQ